MRARTRSQKGQGIIEGAVGLVLIIGGAVIGALLILNCGAGIFFKNKLLVVSTQAAQYAAAHSHDSGVNDEVTAYVQHLMQQVGMTPNNLAVSTNAATIDGQNGMTVAITNSFPLFGNGSVLPCQIQLNDTEFAAIGSSAPASTGNSNAVAYMEVNANGAVGYVPIVCLSQTASQAFPVPRYNGVPCYAMGGITADDGMGYSGIIAGNAVVIPGAY